MSKGILKRQESLESTTPDSASKHVKWDEEQLKVSEAIKMTIPKGQIDEPKTPFQHGQYGSSCDEDSDHAFNLRNDDTEEESFRRGSLTTSENESSFSSHSGGWESSVSEFETDADGEAEEKEKHEKFKLMRAQHYFMKQALQQGKELIETDEE